DERAVFADDGKVDLREARKRVHAGRVPARRNGALHLRDARRIGELRDDGFGRIDDGALEVIRQKERRFGEAKFKCAVEARRQLADVPLVTLWRDLRVEQTTKARIHGFTRLRLRSARRRERPDDGEAARGASTPRSGGFRAPDGRRDRASFRRARGTTAPRLRRVRASPRARS